MYSMYLKSGREGEIERDLSSVCSLPKWREQVLVLSSTAFPGTLTGSLSLAQPWLLQTFW